MFNNMLIAMVLSITTVSAMESVWKEGISEHNKIDIGAGRYLTNPLIRITPEEYAQKNDPKILVLGGGHVLDPYSVEPKDFQPEGENALRESYSEDYTYHQNQGRYSVSAEVTESFGSDMVCDLCNPNHQKILARTDFWDLIWDDSGHIAVFEAPGLLEQIPTWLKPGGKYVIGIPSMADREDSFNESTASIARKIVHLHEVRMNERTPELVDFVVTSLKKIGFSEVDVRLSPTLKAFSALGISDWETITETEGSQLFKKSKEYTEEAAAIHPVFSEASLGMIYIVATR